MSSVKQTIIKNASVLMGSQLATWSLTILLMVVLTRNLGPESFGAYGLALAIWAITSMAVSFGMDTLLIKEIAREPSRTSELFGTNILLRTLFFVLGFGAVFIYTLVMAGKYSEEAIGVIYIIGVGNLFVQYASACRSVLQGLERMEFISYADIAAKAFTTVVSVVLLLLGYGVFLVASVTVVANFINFIIQFRAVKKVQPIEITFNPKTAAWMLRSSLTYLAIQSVLVLYIQVDIVIISLLVDETTIGWYDAADRLFSSLLFIPSVFIAAVFPALSRMYAQNSADMPNMMRKSYDLMILFSVPIGLGILVISGPLVLLLFGPKYVNSGPVLAAFGVVIILTYLNMLAGSFLISSDRQNSWTKVMAIGTLATIPLDLILIPWTSAAFGNGALGGAFAFIVTEIGMVIAGIYLLPKGTVTMRTASIAARALLAGGAMVLAAWPLRELFIAIPIGVGAIVYIGLILLMRAVPKEDLNLALDLGRKIIGRIRKTESKQAGVQV